MALFRGLGRVERLLRTGLRNASKFAEERMNEEAHATRTLYLWKRISLFVAVPGISYISWKCFVSDVEHVEHRKYHPWPHLRIRNKPFPWRDSDKTLFHNPHTNPGPDSEEDEAEALQDEASADPEPSMLNILWQKYLFEDPEERDRQRDEHLAKMQKRVEEYQEKKKMHENPIQPLRDNFQKNWNNQPVNPVESVQNLT